MSLLEIGHLSVDADVLAPDGSEIRLLPVTERGSMVHCALQPGKVSMAVVHRTVEEIWFFVEGSGEVWRKFGDEERCDTVFPGASLTIPTGTHFQFRNTGTAPLKFVIATMPPWPGAQEAYRVDDHWAVE